MSDEKLNEVKNTSKKQSLIEVKDISDKNKVIEDKKKEEDPDKKNPSKIVHG